jgi:alpha-beta hydrolase superfamily lysophospholipase
MSALLTRWLLIGAIALALLILAAAVFAGRHAYDTTLLLADLARVDLPLPDSRPAFERDEAEYTVSGQHRAADVYLPQAAVRAALVLVPGAAEGGRRDTRLEEFAGALARSGFAVVVPDVPALRELRLTPDSVADVSAAIDFLRTGPRTAPYLGPDTRLGIGAFSVAAGLAVLAALESESVGKLDFLLLVGGYYDLRRTLGWLTTGHYETVELQQEITPDSAGKWVYALSHAQTLPRASDREALAELARGKLADPAAETDDLVHRLGPEGRSVYDFIVNREPGRVHDLIGQLPAAARSDIVALDLAGHDLGRLGAELILVHGLDDNIIPWGESVALAAAVPADRVRLYLLHGLRHVDGDFQVSDAWRTWWALRALLSQRI